MLQFISAMRAYTVVVVRSPVRPAFLLFGLSGRNESNYENVITVASFEFSR